MKIVINIDNRKASKSFLDKLQANRVMLESVLFRLFQMECEKKLSLTEKEYEELNNIEIVAPESYK